MSAPLLLGHFGGNNAGDEAILDGTCHLLAAEGVTAVRVVARCAGYRPQPTVPVAVETVRAGLRPVVAALRDASGVVLCGGTHFEDDFPWARRMRHYRYLALYLLVLAAARAMGRPVVAIGQGFGPLRHPAGRALARALSAVAHAGTVRDDASFAVVRQLGGRTDRWTRTFDTAAAVSHRVRPVEQPRRSLVVAPVRLADPRLWDACVGAVDAAWCTLGVDRIEVLTVRSGEREDDCAVGIALASRLGAFAPCRSIVFDGDVDVLVDSLADARAALCGRYHSLILAVLAGTVPIVLPAHPKLLDAAHQLGVPEALLVREPTARAVEAALRAAADLDARKLRPTLDDLRETLAHDRRLLGAVVGGTA